MDVLKVGSNIDAWCTRCKLVLAHTIEAIAAGRIKRVQCNTCRGQHQYKASEPGTSTRSTKSLKESRPTSRAKPSEYIRLVAGKDIGNAASYDISRHFVKGELIKHNHFGVGVVVLEKDASKIEVLFETGAKILIHARV